MHWKSNPTPKPAAGDTRTRVRFAWLPKRIGEATYWLCQYEELYAYEVRNVAGIVGDTAASFPVGAWVLVSAKPVKWVPA